MRQFVGSSGVDGDDDTEDAAGGDDLHPGAARAGVPAAAADRGQGDQPGRHEEEARPAALPREPSQVRTMKN